MFYCCYFVQPDANISHDVLCSVVGFNCGCVTVIMSGAFRNSMDKNMTFNIY